MARKKKDVPPDGATQPESGNGDQAMPATYEDDPTVGPATPPATPKATDGPDETIDGVLAGKAANSFNDSDVRLDHSAGKNGRKAEDSGVYLGPPPGDSKQDDSKIKLDRSPLPKSGIPIRTSSKTTRQDASSEFELSLDADSDDFELSPRPNRAADYVHQKHAEFAAATRLYTRLYYSSRVLSGGCAALLPFFVTHNAEVAAGLAIAVTLISVLDMVFDFGRRMQVYARATSMLTTTRLKRTGEYGPYAEALGILENIDAQLFESTVSIDQVVRRADDSAAPKK